jgi:hypothetical protein
MKRTKNVQKLQSLEMSQSLRKALLLFDLDWDEGNSEQLGIEICRGLETRR